MKTETRILAEEIQKITGQSLVKINHDAWQFISLGVFKTTSQALNYMLQLEVL
jgi:hypothetical protein